MVLFPWNVNSDKTIISAIWLWNEIHGKPKQTRLSDSFKSDPEQHVKSVTAADPGAPLGAENLPAPSMRTYRLCVHGGVTWCGPAEIRVGLIPVTAL